MAEEREAFIGEAMICRVQAMAESLITLQIEILAHLSGKTFKEISDPVWSKINSETKKLIELHSHLPGDHVGN